MSEQQPMSISNQESAGMAVFQLISEYEDLPFKATAETLQWQNLGSKEGIGIYVMQGAYYISKYVSGSYKGLVPLRIIYKTNPTSNKGRKAADDFMNSLASWLEKCTATFTDEHMELESIERTSPVLKQDADEQGNELYMFTINLKYFYKM